jgi:hypothetical protein
MSLSSTFPVIIILCLFIFSHWFNTAKTEMLIIIRKELQQNQWRDFEVHSADLSPDTMAHPSSIVNTPF